MDRRFLTRFAWLSIAAAILTIGLKTSAYLLTHSVGLLSDAVESLVNLVGALMALAMLTVAARPADEDHTYGHSKAEYFSSVVEGTLILVAAVSIGVAAVGRIFHPRPLEQIGLGIAVSIVASLINLGVAFVIMRAGKKHQSITLEANAHHLFTDVWTSAGVLVGVGAVALTGWQWLDPMVALVVAANITWTGFSIVRQSVAGLMDAALPAAEQRALREALERYAESGAQFHALRTRQAGPRRFVSVHILVPGDWTVMRGHELLNRIEADIYKALPGASILTHLEPQNDPSSFDDIALEQPGAETVAPAAAGPATTAPAGSAAWSWPDSMDALVAAPRHHTLLFQNERVRVLDTRIAPGDTVPVHTHRWPSALYVLSWSDFVRRDGHGKVLVDSRDAGAMSEPPKVLFAAPMPPHTLENVGQAELRVINVELKDAGA